MPPVQITPTNAKSGALVLVFGKIVWRADDVLITALQKEGVIEPFKYVPRALNTKVLAFKWQVAKTEAVARAQSEAIGRHEEIHEGRVFAIPELAKLFIDDDDKPVPYMDGGELSVAVARGAPEHLAEAMPYLRSPQRPDWFMDVLATVADETKDARHRALIYDAITSMPVPPTSNKHRKTYVRAVTEAVRAYRAAGDEESAKRLDDKARLFAKKR